MKKLLLLAAVAIASASTTAFAEIEVGKPYYMKLTTGEYYLNLESAPTTKDFDNASLTSSPYIVYFGAGEGDNAGKFTIATSDNESAKYLGSNDTWQSTKTDSPYYWSFNQEQNSTTSNIVVTVQGHKGYLGPNNVTPTNGLPIYTNHDTNNANIHWELIPVTAKIITITLNYKIGDNILGTQSISGAEGDEYVGTLPAFTQGSASGTIPSSDQTIDIQVTQKVPFQLSEDTEHMIWQAVSVHSNKHWILTYGEDESQILYPYNGGKDSFRHNENNPWSDEELWGFTGDLINGFKIYNKKAGTDKTIYMADGGAKVGVATENNAWSLMKSSTNISTDNGCAFRIGTSNPMNAQNGKLVFSWSDPDPGSTWTFYSLADPMINYYNNTLVNVSATNIVGDYAVSPDLSKIAGEKTAAENNPYDEETALAFHNAIVALEENTERNAFDDTKWYRFVNVSYSGEYMVISSDDDKMYGGERAQSTNHNSLFKFEPTETENLYYIHSQGMYVGHPTAAGGAGNNVTLVSTESERGQFELVAKGNGKYALRDRTSSSDSNNRSSLHHANHNGGNQIVGWGDDTGASHWYLIPAENLEVSLTERLDDSDYLGFGYFPFPVVVESPAVAHFVFAGTDNNSTEVKHVVSYGNFSDNKVPANTPFMIISEINNANITIDYNAISTLSDDVTTSDNCLSGHLRKKNAESGDYIIGANENGYAQFVKVNESTPVAANIAYIPKANLHESVVADALPFNSPDSTTGIVEVSVDSRNDGGIYDLQGRRLSAPVKGINIINGKKVLVK